ncbi:MAG: MerR family transcriptional regulator [Bacteroidaceae bacterium]|nr:MerR family transcriptional regulator [Bacteroidaceae bacterium]
MLNRDKNLKMYYSIKEVAQQLGVTETLLRYWEKVFPSIAPRKGGRDIRQYSEDDLNEVKLVYNLVKVKGMKLSAARDAIAHNRNGVQNNTELLERLQGIRAQLVALKKELDNLV